MCYSVPERSIALAPCTLELFDREVIALFYGGWPQRLSFVAALLLPRPFVVVRMLLAPDLLILDEATANIDTITEQLLQAALDALPRTTTRVVIAHRLNTIAAADQIFFVNGGVVQPAGSLEHAIELLLHGKRTS